MTASRTTNLIASGLISLAIAIVLFGAAQAITTSAAASAASYSAPTYGSVMLDMGEEF
jgi:hypothetical protein